MKGFPQLKDCVEDIVRDIESEMEQNYSDEQIKSVAAVLAGGVFYVVEDNAEMHLRMMDANGDEFVDSDFDPN